LSNAANDENQLQESPSDNSISLLPASTGNTGNSNAV